MVLTTPALTINADSAYVLQRDPQAAADTVVTHFVEQVQTISREVKRTVCTVLPWPLNLLCRVVVDVVTQTITTIVEVADFSSEFRFIRGGGLTSLDSIDLDGDIYNFGAGSKQLIVNADGSIDPASNVSAAIQGGTIFVDDILSDGTANIGIFVPKGSVGGSAVLHLSKVIEEVRVVNHSNLDLVFGTVQMVANDASDVEIEPDIDYRAQNEFEYEIESSIVDSRFEVLNHGEGDVLFTESVRNVAAEFDIFNQGGNILVEDDEVRFEVGAEGIALHAAAGSIGAADNPFNLRVVRGEQLPDGTVSNAPVQVLAMAGQNLYLDAVGVINTFQPFDPADRVEGIWFSLTAQGDVGVTISASEVLDIDLVAHSGHSHSHGGDEETHPVEGTYYFPSVVSHGGNVSINVTAGDLGIGAIDAPTGSVIASASGAVLDFDDDAATDINGLDIELDAGRSVGTPGNALEIDSHGTVKVQATQGIHLVEVAGELVANVASGGGPLDAAAVQDITLREIAGNLRIGQVVSAEGDVAIDAFGSITDGKVAGGDLSFVAGGGIVLDIDSAGLVTAQAVQDIALNETAGDLLLGLVSSAGAVQLTAAAAIRDDEAISIQAASAVLDAGAGIGASDNPLDTAVGALQAHAGSGGLWLVNTGALDVGAVTADGEVDIVALSPLVVSGDVVGESVYLEATDGDGPGDDLTVQAGASVTATAGDVVLLAGDDLVIEAGSVVSAQGAVSLSAGGNLKLSGVIDAESLSITGNDEDNIITITQVTAQTTVQARGGNDTVVVGGGSVDAIDDLLLVDGGDGEDVLEIDETAESGPNQGALTSSTITGLGMSGSIRYGLFEDVRVRLGEGEDVFMVASTHAGATRVDGGAGDDTITVGEGDLATIGGQLAIAGGEGDDRLVLDDTADAADNTGTLTGDLLMGLGLPHGIAYAVEQLDVELGAGADAFYVRGTSAVTNLRLNGGDDRIYVTDDGRLDGIQGALNIDAGAGRHRLEISDAAATEGDGDVLITDLQPVDPGLSASAEIWITGFAPAGISFEASRIDGTFYDGIEILLGSGADHLRIDGTHQRAGGLTTTILHAGSGEDAVSVALDADEDGAFLLYLDEGDDTVDASASTLPLVLLGGAGNDHLTSGSGDDLIFGDNAAVDIANGADTNPRWRALLGNTLYDAVGSVQVGAEQAVPGGAPYWEGFGIRLLDDAGGDDVVNGGAGHDQIFGQAGDDLLSGDEGEDYIEGNAGADTIYGGMGQDDLVGGSSSLFSLEAPEDRPDGADLIFGGDGADVIVGDNGNIYRIAGAQFAYDAAYDERIVVRVAELLDYAIGDADEIHGDLGDDVIYGQRGDDRLFGDAGDDDLIGGQGNDRISGDAGQDGILGDDGRLFTSRNGTAEPLYGILSSTPQSLSTPGNKLQADIDVDGELKKSVYLAPPGADGDGDDVLFGGLDGDWLHGGGGNDALSGEEGNDALFGNGGDDQLVGGLDSDHLYGGSGNDVLDAGGDNAADIAFGGVGDDTLIADIAGDRLIDWVGASNTFITPSNGMPTVMRMPAPWMVDFLRALARGDGADITSPDGELGLATPANAQLTSVATDKETASIDWQAEWTPESHSPYAAKSGKPGQSNVSDFLLRPGRAR